MNKSKFKCICLFFALSLLPSMAMAQGGGGQKPFQQLMGVLTILLAAFFIKGGLLALMLTYSVLKPQKVMLGTKIANQSPLRSFFLGILTFVIFLFFALIANVLPKNLAAFYALPIVLFFFYFVVTGLSMTGNCIGEKIQSNTSSCTLGSTFFAVLFGGGLLFAVNFLPFLGQLVLVVASILSLGLAVQVTFRKQKKPESVVDQPPESSESSS